MGDNEDKQIFESVITTGIHFAGGNLVILIGTILMLIDPVLLFLGIDIELTKAGVLSGISMILICSGCIITVISPFLYTKNTVRKLVNNTNLLHDRIVSLEGQISKINGTLESHESMMNRMMDVMEKQIEIMNKMTEKSEK